MAANVSGVAMNRVCRTVLVACLASLSAGPGLAAGDGQGSGELEQSFKEFGGSIGKLGKAIGQTAKDAALEIKDAAVQVGIATKETAGEVRDSAVKVKDQTKETAQAAGNSTVDALSSFFHGLSDTLSGWAASLRSEKKEETK
jgi:hypothetical protein